MKLIGTSDESMTTIMSWLMGGYFPLKVKMKDGSEIVVKASFGKDKPVTVVPTNTNSELRITLPVKIPSLDVEGYATFDYAIDHDAKLAHPTAGFKITIE